MKYIPIKLNQSIIINELYSVHYFENYKNYFFPGEKHEFWEIVYVDRGEIMVETDLIDDAIKLEQGDLIVHRPNEFHQFYADNIMPHNLFVSAFECDSQALIELGQNPVYHLKAEASSHISRIISESKACFSSVMQDPNVRQLQRRANVPFGAEQIIKIMLELLLIQIYRGEAVRSDEDARRGKRARISENYVEKAVNFLKSNLHKNISLTDVCEEVGISRSQLQKMFLRTKNKNVMKYLKELRIEEAKFLIRSKNLSFTEISSQLCYSTVHHFSHQFKELTGMSPTEYARSILLLTQNSTNTYESNKSQI